MMEHHIVHPAEPFAAEPLLYREPVRARDFGVRERKRLYFVRGGREEGREQAGKKWLRAPLFGPATYVCYDCATTIDVTYFAVLRCCPDCDGRRFLPYAHAKDEA